MKHETLDPDPISKARLRLWLKLLKTSREVEVELRRRFRDDHDTTLPRFDVLSALDRHPEGLKMSEISGALRVSNGNVTGIVDRLVSEGLAERCQVPGDRRAQKIRLTGAGRDSFATLAAAHEGWIDRIFTHLDAQDAARLTQLLTQLTPEDDL